MRMNKAGSCWTGLAMWKENDSMLGICLSDVNLFAAPDGASEARGRDGGGMRNTEGRRG